MPVFSKIVSIGLRVCQLAAAGVATGVVGSQLHDHHDGDGLPFAKFMYFAVVAGISCLLSLLWLLPSKGGFAHWPVDVLVSFAWIAVFALLVNWMATGKCKDSTNTLGDMNLHDYCGRGRANEALSILSAILWLLSAIVGLWFIHRESRKKKRDTVVTLSQGA